MKILFLSQRVPFPPNKGDKLRSFNQIRFLSKQHQVSLVCLTDNHDDLAYKRELQPYCHSVDIVHLSPRRSRWQSILALFSPKPFTLAYFFSQELQDCVDRKLRENCYDAVWVYCSSMAQYIENIQGIPRLIDFVDVDSEKWHQYTAHASFPKTLLYRLESSRLRRYEARVAAAFDRSFFVSGKEADDFRALVIDLPTVVSLANGVDGELFQPAAEPYDPETLVFCGAMDYFANVEAIRYFIREILPHIREQVPKATLTVVGSNPAKELTELAQEYPGVVVTGQVERVQPFVHKAAVFVAPMRIARGVQNKILEAMAMGVPVVTTSLGFEGIDAIAGRDITVADDPETFARRVVEIMTDPELRKNLSRNGRRAVEKNYDWDTNLQTMEDQLLQLTAR